MGKLTSLDVLDTLEVAPGRFVVTPHPITLDGQTNVEAALLPGDTLHAFLSRSIDLSDQWEVSIGGVVVPAEHWLRVKPKHGQTIEVRGAVNKQVLMIVALAALTYFTFGAGSVVGLGGAYAGTGAYVAAAALYAGGSMVINKVLGPKPPKARNADDRESVFSLSAPRNRVRINEPLGLLFGGPLKIAPDVLSLPYTWYQGNDQYLAMVLTPGINVGRIAAYQNGDTPLASFDGVQTWTAGMAGMPNQPIPLYSNADTINGAELPNTGVWVERRTSIDTVRIQVNLEYLLGGQGTSSKSYNVSETAEFQYRPAGGTTWAPLTSRTFRNDDFNIKRDTLAADVARGEYDVRGRILGQGNYSGKNTQKNDFTWSTMTSVQADDTDYAGISRFAVQMKATGQLQGAPDEIRVEATADAMPIWNGTAWVTATDRASGLSNPGAQILQYARGFYDQNGKLIAGMGLDDELIDIPALQAFMLHCTANGYTYDYWLQSVRGHTETINAIALAGFGHLSWASGRLSVVWAAADQPLSGVVNMATIKKGQFQVDYTLANAADGVEFTYFDRTDWQAKTLRVPAPGVTTMLNPATIQGEGITDELHAAEMARYHVAQHIYQYKDISYSTRLEHLSYQRLSVLSLQHDLTQWGFGGRIRAAVDNGSSVTLTLDEPVPAPASGSAYIGLRIPGEAVFRVFTVQAFAGESDTITIIGAWPNDAALPGDVPDNLAHDTIWIYDFKQTPGYRVRVVDIQPEPGMKGAGVAVVPEGPEFWNYVKTGDYVPAPNQSLLQTRPVASNLKISESQIVQGDTVFTELAVTFDVSGPVGSTVVLCGEVGNPIEEVAQTLTRTAKWRIPRAGAYTIVVRPISPDGMPGVSASINYTTSGADAPPRLFDFFDVQELSGGVRKYVFSHDDDPPANLAGAEIRYTAGNVPAPTWSAMTPLGVDGFFTSAVEMVIPVAGEWTFACRARNTNGTLSTTTKVLTKTLTGNLGEVIGGLEGDIAQSDQAAADALAAALAADAKAAQEAIDRARDIAGVSGAIEYDPAAETPANTVVRTASGIYRATQSVPASTPPPNATYWHPLGTLAGLADGQAGQSSAIFDLQATTENLGLEQALMAGALIDVQTELPGKASTQSVSLLHGELNVVDGKVAANSGAISQVSAALIGGGNLLRNSGYSRLAGWSPWFIYGGSISSLYVAPSSSDPGVPSGASALICAMSPINGGALISHDWLIPVEAGKAYIQSAYVSGNSPVELYLSWQDASGNPVGPDIASGLVSPQGGGSSLLNYTRLANRVVAPTGAVRAKFGYNQTSSPSATFARWVYPMFEQVSSIQSSPSPYAAGGEEYAQITQSLTANVGPGGAYAQATMMMDVNGRVSGTRQTNNGAESIFSVLADTSEFVSADGSFTITGGRVITRSGGFLDVKGKPFGLGGDLVEWYGPDVGNISNCSRSNAIFFKTNTGIFYAKGMIFAGTITAGGQTLALNATSYTTGTFGTNGGPIQVNASFAHSKRQNAGQIGTTKNTIAKGAGTNGGSIELWRRIGGGGWEFVSGTTFGGTLNVVNYPDPEVAGYAQWSLGGSITYTDNVGGTAAREYEVRLTSLTMQDVTITGTAPIPAATEGRNIGVLTAEG